jgi:TRAP-type C4-dicarboxylate transport system substrate-binding protein
MRSNRRTFLKATAAAAAASALPLSRAFAADELKLATFVPPTHPIPHYVFTPVWFPEVEKKSGGTLKIRLYPSMQLGGKPPELYRQTLQGISDMCFTLPGYTSNDFPMMALTELPGLSKTGEQGTRNLWAALDKYLSGEFKSAKVLMLWNNDEAALMSKSKPIRTLDDMKGMKIRTPSAAQSAQLEALGAIPIDMPANQIYNSLDRGVVDAAMIPVSGAVDFKLIEVARYFTLGAPLGRSPFLVAMNQARYDKLTPEQKKAIDETTGLLLSLKGTDTYEARGRLAVEQIKKDRELIMLSDAEYKRWMDAFKPLISQKVAEAEKAGLPAKGLLGAYGINV